MVTVSASLVMHVLVLGVPCLPHSRRTDRPRRLLLVEPQSTASTPTASVDLFASLRSRLGDAAMAPGPSMGGLGEAHGGAVMIRPVIGVNEPGGVAAAIRSGGGLPHDFFSGAAVDLTDLAQAAQGDPVRLSYFAAIREQLQQAANQRPWLGNQISETGLVCVGFVLTRTGDVSSSAVVPDRSADSSSLRNAALQIVAAARPFPPLPPSFLASSSTLTVLVPIEFDAGH